MLDQESIQSRLHLPADQQFSRWESGLVRQLYDCPDVPVGPEGCRCRVVVATHPAPEKKSRIGHTRKGVVSLGKKPGRSSRNGFGTCAWNWGISSSRQRCAPPSLRELCPRLKRSSTPPRAMASPQLLPPGKLAASLGRTLPSSRMEQCIVPLATRWLRTNNAEKPMEASVWCTRPASAVVAPALYATSANGKEMPRRNRGR